MLSSHTLEALKEFLNEQQQNHLEEKETSSSSSEVALVAEDWRLSQFWYDQHTAETIVREIQLLCADDTSSCSVACIACPTLYAYLKLKFLGVSKDINTYNTRLVVPGQKIDPSISVSLLEYDKRFEQYGSDFTFYDYNQPEELSQELKHAYRVIIADPPYLSKECLEKVAQTMKFLIQPGDSHLLLLTGGVQTERAAELLSLYPCGFKPQHSSKLGNEFLLFTNYDPGERLGGWELNN
ncbi:hypothetical protein IFM89_007896 [Coptis chinensis]|uniref:Protein-lysine N-methyltransferase IFM89_007896 n=1 Tax=Coptis chinensis TaxID=261450 RepID=A0A835LLT7_9MAGN|nr:hypothetical protein IFM89_007896 [Coptis chinensis]